MMNALSGSYNFHEKIYKCRGRAPPISINPHIKNHSHNIKIITHIYKKTNINKIVQIERPNPRLTFLNNLLKTV